MERPRASAGATSLGAVVTVITLCIFSSQWGLPGAAYFGWERRRVGRALGGILHCFCQIDLRGAGSGALTGGASRARRSQRIAVAQNWKPRPFRWPAADRI